MQTNWSALALSGAIVVGPALHHWFPRVENWAMFSMPAPICYVETFTEQGGAFTPVSIENLRNSAALRVEPRAIDKGLGAFMASYCDPKNSATVAGAHPDQLYFDVTCTSFNRQWNWTLAATKTALRCTPYPPQPADPQ